MGVLTLFLLGSVSHLAWLMYGASNAITVSANVNYKLSPEEKGLLEEGDIILRRGEGFISGAIARILSHEPFNLSHCAMLTRGKKDWLVVHAVSSSLSDFDGVQREPLDRFSATSVDSSIVVIRYKGSPEIRKKMGLRAREYCNAKIPFDHAFDLEDSSSFYCTELLHRIFIDVLNEDLFMYRFGEGHPGYIHFDGLLNPTYFELILNHQGIGIEKRMNP